MSEHIIERVYRFLLEYIDEKGSLLYLDKIDEMISEDQRSLYVDLQHLESFDPVVVDEIIAAPKIGLEAAADALKQVLLGKEPEYLTRMQNRLHLRFNNPPDRIKKSLRKIRSAALGTLISTEAIITKSTEVKPYLEIAAFRCVRCQALQPSIRFTEGEYNPPFACVNATNQDDPCTSKSFTLIKDQSTFIDFQRVSLQEKPEELPSGQMPESLTTFLRDDLCDLIRPGDRVKLVGIMESRTDSLLTRGKMPLFMKYIEGVSIEKETEEFTDLEISEEDEEAIKNLSGDPNIHRMIRNSIAPIIFGALEEKEAISYLLFGGSSKIAGDGTKIRGESNILLIGDPGMGKCVHPDTELLLTTGERVTIGDYIDSHISTQYTISDGYYEEIETNVVSIDKMGKLEPTTSNIIWKRKSPEFLYKITTQSGRKITVTDTHPFFTIHDSFIKAIPAKDLTTESIIAVPRSINITGNNSFNVDFRKKEAHNAIRLQPPQEVYPWFAEFLGLLLAEGYSAINDEESAHISFTNNNMDLITTVIKALDKLGLNYNTRKHMNCNEVYCGSSELYYFLEAIDPCIVSRSAQKRIPNIIMKATDESVAAFLRAFFDGEASVETASPTIEVASASYNMLKDIQVLFLRFEILSQLKSKMVNGTEYYRLRITGKSNLRKYYDHISFTIDYKVANLKTHIENTKVTNTNKDIVPNLAKTLRMLRTGSNLFQKDFDIPRTTYRHYERGDRYPSRQVLQQVTKVFREKVKQENFRDSINRVETLAHSDIYWDKIEKVECIKSDTEWVYDLQVPEVHNFIANNIIVHNSQILKSVADLVPRGLYTSGRGSSAAGLCVAADSKLFLSNGLSEIGPVVEEEFESGKFEEHSPGIFFKQNNNSKNKTLHSTDLKIKPAEIDRYWKLKSPKKLFHIQLKTGRSIKLTAQTTLLSISSENGLIWNPASNLSIGDRIATVKELNLPLIPTLPIIDHLKSYDREITLCNVGKKVELLINQCTNKLKISKRDLAKKLQINEDNIYYRYINDEIQGSISFKVMNQLCSLIGIPINDCLEFPLSVQIKKGQNLILPYSVTTEWFYILGLLFGDGRVSKTEKESGSVSYAFGLSNNEDLLINSFNQFFTSLGLHPYLTKATESRPQEIRVANSLLFHIFSFYGLIESPKSDRLEPSDIILQLEDKYLVSFLQGLYDSDGWVSQRNEDSEGSSQIGYASTSKKLIDFIQNALLRYGILSYIREKNFKTTILKDGRIITPKHNRYEITFTKYSDFIKFNENIGFKHPKKQLILEKICENTKKAHSNIDNIPNVYSIIAEIFNFYDINSKAIFGRKGALTNNKNRLSISKHLLNKILTTIHPDVNNHRIKLSEEIREEITNNLKAKYDKIHLLKLLNISSMTFYDYFERKNRWPAYTFEFILDLFEKCSNVLNENTKITLENIINEVLAKDDLLKNKINLLQGLNKSDLFWDEIKDIKLIDSENEYVYDLTVNKSHNFIVNGIVVHNTASVIRDQDTGEMTLEAGAVVLADKGIAFIDEFDKMRKEDRSALHEAMEQHSVSIAKAGIVATLNARTSILAAANPKLGRWDTKKDAIDNLNLPSTIISRFDLIFPIIDTPNRNEDELKASHILKIHQEVADAMTSEEALNKVLLRKYISYARKNIHPHLSNEAREEIMKFYLDLREGKGLEPAVTEYNTDQGLAQQQGQKPRTIAITPRQLESLIRLSEARAKIALRNEVTREDAVRVIELFKSSLNRVTKGDIDTLYGMSSQKRNKRETILNVITNLSQGNATPDMDDIMRKAREEGMEDGDIRDMIDQLLQNGEIYEPRPGTFKKMTD